MQRRKARQNQAPRRAAGVCRRRPEEHAAQPLLTHVGRLLLHRLHIVVAHKAAIAAAAVCSTQRHVYMFGRPRARKVLVFKRAPGSFAAAIVGGGGVALSNVVAVQKRPAVGGDAEDDLAKGHAHPVHVRDRRIAR